MKIIYGKRFYQYLLPGHSDSLYNNYSIDEIRSKHIICSSTDKTVRMFALFDTVDEFYEFQSNYPDNYKCFYEVILGENKQKPHFDIDCKKMELEESEKIKDELIEQIMKVSTDYHLNLSMDILLFTSHSDTKKSYHVVIDNYFHNDNIDGKTFYLKVMSFVDEKYKVYMDSVYSTKQQFRLLGSTKFGENRHKVFCNEWNFKGTKIKFSRNLNNLELLKSSFVNFTENCKPFMKFEIQEKFLANFKSEEIEEEAAKTYLEYFKKKHYNSKFSYEMSSVKNNMILLKRLDADKCIICKRTHEHENPFLFLTSDNNLYYSCRRSKFLLLVGNFNDKVVENKILNDEYGEYFGDDIEEIVEEENEGEIKLVLKKPFNAKAYSRGKVKKIVRECLLIHDVKIPPPKDIFKWLK